MMEKFAVKSVLIYFLATLMLGYSFQAGQADSGLEPENDSGAINWAEEGGWVYVHDPSGKTPTDPAVYGEGGA